MTLDATPARAREIAMSVLDAARSINDHQCGRPAHVPPRNNRGFLLQPNELWLAILAAAWCCRWIAGRQNQTIGDRNDDHDAAQHLLNQAEAAVKDARELHRAASYREIDASEQIIALAWVFHRSWTPGVSIVNQEAVTLAKTWWLRHDDDHGMEAVATAIRLVRHVADLTGEPEAALDQLGAELFEAELREGITKND